MSMLKSGLKIFTAMAIVLIITGITYQYFGTKADEAAYQPVGKMIDIGGYTLHMIDSNIGKTTVVIDSSLGEKTIDWCLVQPEIAKFARVVTYDRAGYAWSDESMLPRTSANIVQELHIMLHKAKIPAPYILIGHAFGGINVRLFASQYPDEVAGVILIDAMHEDLFKKIPQFRPNSLSLYGVLAANYLGVLRALNLVPAIKNKMHDKIAKYPAFLQRIYPFQITTTKYINAMIQEALLLEESCKQLQAATGLLGDKPLTVITSGQQPIYEQIAGCSIMPEDVGAYHAAWLQLQADLVKKSSCSSHIFVANNGCIISTDQPNIIIGAVHDMINELHAGR